MTIRLKYCILFILVTSCSNIDTYKPQKNSKFTPTITTTGYTLYKAITYTIIEPSSTTTPINTYTITEIWNPRIDYKIINIEELDNNTEKYIGEMVQIRGIILYFDYPYFYLRAIDPSISEEKQILVCVLFAPVAQAPDVYEGDDVVIYGIVKGRIDAPNEKYEIVSQILIDIDFVELFIDKPKP
jgi:hypothetical protein